MVNARAGLLHEGIQGIQNWTSLVHERSKGHEDGADLGDQRLADLIVGSRDLLDRSLGVPIGNLEGFELGSNLEERGDVVLEVGNEEAVVLLGGLSLASRPWL
jgi:hypothetical protein